MRRHAKQAREKALKKQHEEYLEDHPEAKQLMNDFIAAALAEQPVDVFEFARDHFKGTATAVPEDAAEDDAAGSMGGGAADQDDLDDLDDMAATGNAELTAHLQQVFESMDKDGSGTISKQELDEKLKADTELQTLLKAAGGDGEWFVLEQLDLDGDGEIVRPPPHAHATCGRRVPSAPLAPYLTLCVSRAHGPMQTWMEFEAMLGDMRALR